VGRDPIRSRGSTRSPVLLPVVSAVAIGAAAGLGFFTFGYADGASYLGNDPEACANCHVMQGHLDAWVKSSHKHVATCNDCHAPHDLLGKYLTKAINGFNHSLAFTTGDFPQNLRITDWNRAVTEGACRSCHAELTHSIDLRAVSGRADEPIACMRCHENVGHLR
jgi:cytochrome c nitrite reductase small subunit